MKNFLKNYIYFLMLHRNFVVSIHIAHMSVPSTVEIGQKGILNCTWALDNGTLYLLNWDRGGDVFYSWSPIAGPKVYPIEGLIVDESKSVGGYVEFSTTSTKAGDVYTCEVSAEFPFDTDLQKKKVEVIDRPDVRPNLTLERMAYKMYDNITIGCNSINAFPDPKLNFFLNNEAVDKNHVSQAPLEDEETGLKTIEANLTIVLEPYMFTNRKLKIKCTAEINNVYWEASEIEFPGDHLMYWENTEIEYRADFAEQYDYQTSVVSRNQSNLIINLLVVMINLMAQASLFVNEF